MHVTYYIDYKKLNISYDSLHIVVKNHRLVIII